MMNALGRKGRARSKRDTNPTPSTKTHEMPPPPTEPFVNHGLEKWNQDRIAWTAKRSDYVPRRTPAPAPEDDDSDTEELYNALITPDYQPLPRNVPLKELILILQDVREQVG